MNIKKLWTLISSVIVVAAFLGGYLLGVFNPQTPEPIVNPDPDPTVQITVEEDGVYDSLEEVALYLITFNKLPSNYVTKNQARKAGWEGGSVEPYFPGCCIGGDTFANREGLLPKKTDDPGENATSTPWGKTAGEMKDLSIPTTV